MNIWINKGCKRAATFKPIIRTDSQFSRHGKIWSRPRCGNNLIDLVDDGYAGTECHDTNLFPVLFKSVDMETKVQFYASGFYELLELFAKRFARSQTVLRGSAGEPLEIL